MGRNIEIAKMEERAKEEQLAEKFYELIADSGASLKTAKRALSRGYEIARANAKILR